MLFFSSATKYRRGRARSQCPSLRMSFHIVFLLQKQRAGTRERTFFRPGSLTRDSWSASKSVIIEVDEWSGDLRSIGMTQITWKGVDLHGTHTQHPGVYCCVLGNASSSSWHVISHRFTWVDTRGRGDVRKRAPLPPCFGRSLQIPPDLPVAHELRQAPLSAASAGGSASDAVCACLDMTWP